MNRTIAAPVASIARLSAISGRPGPATGVHRPGATNDSPPPGRPRRSGVESLTICNTRSLSPEHSAEQGYAARSIPRLIRINSVAEYSRRVEAPRTAFGKAAGCPARPCRFAGPATSAQQGARFQRQRRPGPAVISWAAPPPTLHGRAIHRTSGQFRSLAKTFPPDARTALS
jgi:hypothetical protein